MLREIENRKRQVKERKHQISKSLNPIKVLDNTINKYIVKLKVVKDACIRVRFRESLVSL